MVFSIKTDKGRVRDNNEDYAYAKDNLLIIADGMGGHNAGEVASKVAVDEAVKVLSEFTEVYKEGIISAIEKANEKVYSMAEGERQGMGTTMDICICKEGKLFLGHVGDSRVYVIRDKKAMLVTKDHSYVEMLLQKGEITKEEAKDYPMKNMITRAVGANETVEVDYSEFKLEKDDKVLLCTDGLTNMVSDEEIAYIIEKASSPDEATDILVKKANESGGKDNITVLVAEKIDY